MERIMATLTHKREPFVRTVRKRGIAASGACLAGVVGIYPNGHTARKQGFVGKIAMQLSKGPGRGMPVGFALFLRGLLASFPLGALTDVCQVFQPDDAVGVTVHDAAADGVVDRLFQPSLSPSNHDESSRGRTSAFVLQPLSQTCIVISFDSHLFPRIE